MERAISGTINLVDISPILDQEGSSYQGVVFKSNLKKAVSRTIPLVDISAILDRKADKRCQGVVLTSSLYGGISRTIQLVDISSILNQKRSRYQRVVVASNMQGAFNIAVWSVDHAHFVFDTLFC